MPKSQLQCQCCPGFFESDVIVYNHGVFHCNIGLNCMQLSDFFAYRPVHKCWPKTSWAGNQSNHHDPSLLSKNLWTFCLIPWKAVKGSWVARMGRNFDDYSGFQLMISWANTYAQDCSLLLKNLDAKVSTSKGPSQNTYQFHVGWVVTNNLNKYCVKLHVSV